MRGQGGFSLMEAVCALAILGVMSSVVFLGSEGRARQARNASAETAAGRLAAGRLAVLRDAPGEVVLGTRSVELDPNVAATLPEPHGAETARRRADGLLEVTVDVSWRAAGSRARRSVRLTTLIVEASR